MTTAADWIAEAEQHLSVADKGMNKLAAAITDTTTDSITLSYNLGAIKDGQIIAIDLEVMRVWEVDDTNKTATVQRGYGGSTAATHLVGSLVYVNPTHTKFAILRALNQDILALSSAGLFSMSTVELTYNAVAAGYDLTSVTNLEGIYRIDAKYTGMTRDWQRIRDFRLARSQNTVDFPSGYALSWDHGGQPGQTVRVVYKSRFTTLSALTTDVSTTGLPTSAYDIPPLGAAARLVSPREVDRNDTTSQGNSRRADEVPAGAVRSAGAGLWAIRQNRINEERAELARLWPVLT